MPAQVTAQAPDYEVLVVGGGLAGLGAAIKLRQHGLTDFALLEKASELGGVWRENTYPGCACDVPSSLYSYSFAPNPNWSRVYAPQAEIKRYVQDTAERFGVMPHIKFNHEAQNARWNDHGQHWEIETPHGRLTSRFVIMACGPMHEPVLPKVSGLKDFNGPVFHSARWNHDVDLTGKRVAVIGNGASALQFVPQIQPAVERLTLFQRTPQWVLPKMDQPLSWPVRQLFKFLPLTQLAVRGSVYGIFESLNGGMRSKAAMRQFQKLALWHLNHHIKDPTLRQTLTPSYLIGCKRVLQSNDWYPALTQPNVSVVASGLEAVEGNTLTAADGSRHAADVVILGTGFEVTAPPIAARVQGRSGETMQARWNGSPEGYMGTMVEDCPNAFLMFGPNLAVSSSAFIILEAQLTYIMDALKKARHLGIQRIEVDPQRLRIFNDTVQNALKDTVWNTGGCTSYFLDQNGRNSTLWPWTTFEMRRQLSRFDINDYLTDRDAPVFDNPIRPPHSGNSPT